MFRGLGRIGFMNEKLLKFMGSSSRTYGVPQPRTLKTLTNQNLAQKAQHPQIGRIHGIMTGRCLTSRMRSKMLNLSPKP